jgi:hypothetical protein
MATGIIDDFLQVQISVDGASAIAYALHRLGDQVLLVPASTAQPTPAAQSQHGAMLDEVWPSPRRYVCSETYPEGAQMAVRAGPNRESAQVATLPAGVEYLATGRCGDYLQIRLDIDGAMTTAFVSHTIGDMVLLVRAAPQVSPQASPACSPMSSPAPAARAALAEAANTARVDALEAKVVLQEGQIQILQNELAALRVQLSSVAAAFRPLAMPP